MMWLHLLYMQACHLPENSRWNRWKQCWPIRPHVLMASPGWTRTKIHLQQCCARP